MTSKEKYKEFCKGSSDLLVFQQPWWLDTVAGVDGWDVVLTSDQNATAALPYCLKSKVGFNYMLMPPLTKYFDPFLRRPELALSTRKILSLEKKSIEFLLSGLPKYDWINLSLHHRVTNWQPFFWKGFNQTTHYSFIINNPSPVKEDLLSTFSKSARREIKKANTKISIKPGLSADKFFEISRMSYNRKGNEVPYTRLFCERVIDRCREEGSGEVYSAEDESGNIHSVLFVVWDKRYTYFLIGGGNPTFRDSGSKFFMYYQLIHDAAINARSVDFSGGMIEDIAYFFKQFGAVPVPYHSITKVNSWLLKVYFALFR